jgi:hypothetical protein
MAMTTITVKDGQKPTKEQIKRIRAAAKAPITYTHTGLPGNNAGGTR